MSHLKRPALLNRTEIAYLLAVLVLCLFSGFTESLTASFFVFLLLLLTLLLSLLALIAARRFVYALLGLIGSFLLTVEVAVNVYQLTTGAKIGSAQAWALLETNGQETLGYLAERPASFALPVLFVLLFVILLKLRGLFQFRPSACVRKGWIALGVLLLMAGVLASPVFFNQLVLGKWMKNYDAHLTTYQKTLQGRRSALDAIGAKQTFASKNGITLIVIGESANRNHLHTYGYFRQTTPVLDALQGPDLITFDNVIASYSGTALSLRRALTLASLDSGKEYYDPEQYTLIEILRAAGVETHWISNQAQHGVWSQLVSTIAEGSDNVFYSTQDDRNADADSLTDTKALVQRPPDSIILDNVAHTIAQSRKPAVIFVHLMGSHEAYSLRYPPTFTRFDAQRDGLPTLATHVQLSTIDAYDNSILYTDFILGQLIDMLKGRSEPSSLLYFSDHGESPYLGVMHDPSSFSIGHVEIPFVLWLSPSYRTQHPTIAQTGAAHLHAPFMLDNLPQFVADLVGVTGPFYKPERSLLNPAFKAGPRRPQDGDVDYDALHEDYCHTTKRLSGFNLKKC